MSNPSSDVFNKNWTKMSKIITTISNAIKDHYKTVGSQQSDQEVLLLSLQLFSVICGKKWGFSQDKLDEMFASCKDLHKLVQAATNDVKTSGELQKPILPGLPKQFIN